MDSANPSASQRAADVAGALAGQAADISTDVYDLIVREMSNEVPIQYFQSIIAVQVAVAGALLFQVRFFDTSSADPGSKGDPRLRLAMAVVITATLFASLEAMREGWGHVAAAFVTAGLALSLLPILLRVLPPLTRGLETQKRDPHLWVTVLGLILYAAIVTIVVLIR